MSVPSATSPVSRTIALCFVTALFEGLDIQSMGVATQLAPAFHLGPGQMGIVLSASTFGLMLSAAAGGSLSDRIGRRYVLVLSMMRPRPLFCGDDARRDGSNSSSRGCSRASGLGGAFPTVIALVSEIASSRSHG